MAEAERHLALGSETVVTFQRQVDSVSQRQVYQLPSLTEHINHSGKYTRPRVHLAEGLFLSPELISYSEKEYGGRPESFTFMAQPGHRLGREKSHNEVFFGKLLSHWHANGNLHEAQVAVKPTKNHAALLGELAMFQYLNDLGMPTFTPTSFLVPENDGTSHLLTRFEKPIATMDTVEWDELETAEKWLQLDSAVKTMALLHSELLFHGDLEFKNVGFDERGELIIIDPELMVSALEMAEIASQGSNAEEVRTAQIRLKQSMSNDFTSVCRSIDEFIITSLPMNERPKNDAAKFKLYARHLFRPYEASLQDSHSLYLPELLSAYEKVFQEHKLRSRQ